MSLVTKIAHKVCKEPGLHYLNPPVPHGCVLPGGLSTGSKIYVQGVCSSSCSRASFNLQRGTGDEVDIYLNLDARIPEKKVVCNSRHNGEWGSKEQDGGCPFAAGKPFLLVITAFTDCYEMEVNGKPFTSFKHRAGLPPSNVTHFSAHGDFMLRAVHVPVEAMPKKVRITIPGNVKVGDQFSIKGIPGDGAFKFVINWQCGPTQSDDVVFQLNPRFRLQGTKKVVRNSRTEDQWDKEEVGGPFPFTPAAPFHVQVTVSSEAFLVRVDGSDCYKFAHRMDARKANVLFIEGDVDITDVQIDSPQGKLLHETSYRDFTGSALEVYYPLLPLVHIIPGGLAPGKFLVVSGNIDYDPSKTYMNLQCGECDDSNCCLQVNTQFGLTNNFVVLNNKDGDWKDEVRVDDSPFAAGNVFEMVALLGKDGYQVAVNGAPLTEFPDRLNISRAQHIALGGSMSVSRILVL